MKDKDEIIKDAHKHLSEGKIDDAIAEYLKILPYSVDGSIQNTIGNIYLKKDSTDEAIKYFREAALIFNKDESHAKAIALYHKILSINPDQHDVVMELAKLDAERGFIKQAVEGLISAAEAYHSKGLPLKALGVYKKTLAVCPSDTELKIKIADLHLETNHTERAAKIYLAIAMEYEANAESVNAEAMYKKVLDLEPDNLESLTHLSRLAEDDQDLELAFEYMSKAASIAPHNSEIMSDYSNLAVKANKDISEYLPQVSDEPDNKKSQNRQLPDAVNNCDTIGNVREPMDLSSDESKSHNIYSSEPISASTSPLPITSTGSGSEETGFTVPPDTGETEVGKNGIWAAIHAEDRNNPSVIDSIRGRTSKALTGHETAEAEYDQDPEEYEFNLSAKEIDHEKTEKNSRRLKKRVKNNRLNISVILFFVIVTGLAFFITFKFIKNTQTVDIETPNHVIPQEPLAIKEVKTRESSSVTSKTSAQNTAKEQVKTKTTEIQKEENIKANDQGVLKLPVRETEPAFDDNKANPDSTDEMTLKEEDNNFADIQKEAIESTITTDSEIAQEKENPTVNTETLTVPETEYEMLQEKENTNVNSETLTVPETENEIQQENENTNVNSETLTVPETEDEMLQENENTNVNSETLTVPETEDEMLQENENTNVNSETLTVPETENEIQQEKENTNVNSETLTVPETEDEMLQEKDHNKKETAIISFNEPFENNENNWEIVKTSAAHVRLEDGKYYILNLRESGAYIILNGPNISTDTDFEIASYLNSLDSSEDHSYGLVFGAKNKEDFFVFQMLPEDTYSIRKYYRGVSLELAGGPISIKLNSRNQFNVFTVKNKENNLSFYINDNFIDEISDISFSNRKTGFFINGKTEVVVDKILLHQQPRQMNLDLHEFTALSP